MDQSLQVSQLTAISSHQRAVLKESMKKENKKTDKNSEVGNKEHAGGKKKTLETRSSGMAVVVGRWTPRGIQERKKKSILERRKF